MNEKHSHEALIQAVLGIKKNNSWGSVQQTLNLLKTLEGFDEPFSEGGQKPDPTAASNLMQARRRNGVEDAYIYCNTPDGKTVGTASLAWLAFTDPDKEKVISYLPGIMDRMRLVLGNPHAIFTPEFTASDLTSDGDLVVHASMCWTEPLMNGGPGAACAVPTPDAKTYSNAKTLVEHPTTIDFMIEFDDKGLWTLQALLCCI